MKVLIGITCILAAVCASWGASAAAAAAAADDTSGANNYETCLARVNQMTKDFVPAEPISQLVSRLEISLDLEHVVELSIAPATSSHNIHVLAYALALERPNECDELDELHERMRKEDTCMADWSWAHEGPKDQLVEGDFGRFQRALFSCLVTKKTAEYRR